MAAITAAKGRARRHTDQIRSEDYVVVSGTTIPQGALVMINTSTREASNGADTASRQCVGVAASTVVGDGVLRVKVEYNHDELFDINANITDASVNLNVCIEDNNQLDTATARTNDVFAGCIRKLESASTAWLAVRVAGFGNT